MYYKKIYQEAGGMRNMNYNQLRQRQCALNMQIRLAMQTYDMEMKANLEKELEEINKQIKYLGG